MRTQASEYNENNCELFNPPQIFYAIHAGTGGDPCHTGCVYFEHEECKGISKPAKVKKTNPKTNAEIGSEIHESPRQVAKMRKNGTLPKGYL